MASAFRAFVRRARSKTSTLIHMCGIAGYVGRGDEKILERMTGLLKHRGPDDGATHIEEGLGLGFRRLAIIDLAGGRQPMSNEDGSVRIVFNGEIYNYKELRAELEKDFRFKTVSDTEVILRLYEKIGAKAFERLWGMFAIAIWDARERSLVVARDRLGKKPLYLLRHADGLVFGSELKAVAAHPACQRKLDLPALSSYLSLDAFPAGHTVYEGVEKLLPAHYGVWRAGSWETKRYWKLPARSPDPNLTDSDVVSSFERLFDDAVARRLVADVPVGVFLSGGVDSSLVAASAMRASGQVRTFSIGFQESDYDESGYARQVAAILGTEHHERILGVNEALSALDEAGEYLDEPFADPSFLPTLLLAKTAREQVTVALSGDGADEVFWGYDTFKAHRVADAYAKLPSALKRTVSAIARRLPTSDRYMSLPFVLERFTRGSDASPSARDGIWRQSIGLEAQSGLFREDIWKSITSAPARPSEWEGEYAHDAWGQMSASYLFGYLPDDILYKADRASMAASLEVRSPFLDHRLVEFGWSLPDRFKLRGLTTKFMLKLALEKHLPKRIIHRKKQGFAPPVAAWLRGPLRERCETYFSPAFQERMGLFKPETVSRWWHEHLERRRDHRKCLWSLLMLCRWYERWMP